MKIIKPVVVISTYDEIANPYYGGGGAHAVHEIARRLVKTYRVIVVCGNYPKAKDKIIAGIEYRHIGSYLSMFPRLSQLLYTISLPLFVRSLTYDLWIESFTPPFSTNFLQCFTTKPVVGLVHMLTGEDMQRKYFLPFRLIETIGLSTYRNFAVNSVEIASRVRQANPQAQVRILGNGIDRVRSNSGRAKYALFMGRFELNQKGIDILLQSWQGLTNKLVLVGSRSGDNRKLLPLINKYHIADRITILNYKSHSRLSKLISDAAFIVIPSRFETYSLAALEAYSYGLPTVSFDIPGLRWIPKGISLKVPAYDTVKFANACRRLFINPKLRLQMGRRAQKFASIHTWDQIAKRYRSYINTLITFNQDN